MKLNNVKIYFFEDFSKFEKRIFYSLVGLYLIFLIFRVLNGNYFLADSFEYLEIATKIKNATYFNQNSNFFELTRRPIIYPLFLSLFLGLKPFFTIIIQSILAIVNVFLLMKILKNHFSVNKKFLLFFIFTPSIFIYTQLLMAESLVLLTITTLMYILNRPFNNTHFAYIQLITILLAFIKPIFYPFIYINFVFFAIYLFKIKKFSFWIFLPIIVLQLFLTYNENRTGYKHFTSIENKNLIDFNLYYFKSATIGKIEAENWIDAVYLNKKFTNQNFKKQNLYLKEIAFQEIKNNYFSYSFYHFGTAIRGVFDPGRFDLMTFFAREDGKQGFLVILNGNKSVISLIKNKFVFIYLLLVPIFLANILKIFFCLKYFIYSKFTLFNTYLILLVIYHVLISGPVNCSRYMMPLQGIMIVFAYLGIKNRKTNCIKKN